MLALRRSRCPLHSLPRRQLRTLRTLPRTIPSYIKGWDPTYHQSICHPGALSESLEPRSTHLNDSNLMRHKEAQDTTHTIATAVEEKYGAEKKHRAIRRLKHLLRLAKPSVIEAAEIRSHLWGAYVRAKMGDPQLLSQLSDRDWEALWNSQSVRSSRNTHRTLRLEELYRDMRFLERPDTVAQRVDYLESLFMNGKEQEALEEWEADNVSSDLQDQHNKHEHLNIGARLHALAGHADSARGAMSRLFQLYPNYDPSVMMTVFRVHTSSPDGQHHVIAKDLYLKMKERKGVHWTIEDYDACLVGFLEARRLRYAKDVFRDMVKDGFVASTRSAKNVDEVLKRLHMLYRLGTDISAMTSIALDAIMVLPPAYHEHLFGDWMKSAVVQKAPEAASQILDMMIQRGYNPDTFHFNMLLKALLRTKVDPNILKAENIAWRMIDEARKACKKALTSSSIKAKISKRMDPSEKLPSPNRDTPQTSPIANVTTFALMMQHHAKKLQWEHVDYLSRQLRELSITPNATIMNVLMDNKCRQGAYAEAWKIYKQLTEPPENSDSEGVYPNGASMRILWKTLRLALGDHATREDANLPTCRDLLKETVEWWEMCRSRPDAERFRMGLAASDHGAITTLIMHCFSYTSDLAGSLVALHILRQKFGIRPTEKAVEILQRQMAWVDMARESASARSQYFHSRSNARNSERIARVYQILAQRRISRMDVKPGDQEKFTKEEVGDMELDLLSEFIRVVMKRTYPPEIVEVMIKATCKSVGVPGMVTGDMDAFEVA